VPPARSLIDGSQLPTEHTQVSKHYNIHCYTPELEDAAPEPLDESRFKQVKGISTKIPCDFYPDSYF